MYKIFAFLSFLLGFGVSLHAQSPAVDVSVNAQTGKYVITSKDLDWTFSGSVGSSISHVTKSTGCDSLGHFHEAAFQWSADQPYTGAIRWYENIPAVLFELTLPHSADSIGTAFPNFTDFPKKMHHYSFRDDVFSPPAFNRLTQTSTPWLFFNDKKEAFILSPASDFIVSKMRGDGEHAIASGLTPELQNIPTNFTHQSILILGKGIGNTWARWGQALRHKFRRKRPANDADQILKYYGYWTDNGADYYYNYDKEFGYAQTLLTLRENYKKQGIPLGYMQLDSWWYEKSVYDWQGNPGADHKNPDLPSGKWNRYGGLMKYRPDSFLFPDGMAAFQEKLNLPLVVHNRWIDPRSPYHDDYEITGYAATGQKFWNDIAQYLNKSGIIDYEQDWLNHIYAQTPKMAKDVSVGNAFTDNMAQAFQNYGMDMQYCMATPRFFMQGVKYNNLTTIRTSGDRFGQERWRHFLYASQLGYALGIWPWSDVFKSRETGNMIMSVLSAGAVGTGDATGKENKANILKAARTDGVLVKPDAALLPMDSDYIHDAKQQNKPIIAHTYTRHSDIQTDYVVAFAANDSTARTFSFEPAELGPQGKVAIYDYLQGSLNVIDSGESFSSDIGAEGYKFYIVAPVTSSGIAFLGDEGKIVSTGRQRIADIKSALGKLQVTVRFAAGESSVKLHGYYQQPITSDKGTLQLHPGNHTFDLLVSKPDNASTISINLTKK